MRDVSNNSSDFLQSIQAIAHGQARRQLSRWPELRTLRPTDLVNEVLLKLLGTDKLTALSLADHKSYPSVLSQAMRDVVIDAVRARRSQKRGKGRRPLPLDDIEERARSRGIDLESLHEALDELATLHPRRAEIVVMKYFGGFSITEIADALRISKATVESDLTRARGWLSLALADPE